MKKVLLAFAVLLGLVACTTNKATSAEKSVVSSEVPFTVAEHYFFNKGQDIPACRSFARYGYQYRNQSCQGGRER